MPFVAARGSFGDIAAGCERARQALGRVRGAGYELDAGSLAKLRYLQRDGRDFRAATPALNHRMAEAFAAKLARVLTGEASPEAPWVAAVDVYLAELAHRLATGGGELRTEMRALTPETVKRKHGDARIGYSTGALQRAVAAVRGRSTR